MKKQAIYTTTFNPWINSLALNGLMDLEQLILQSPPLYEFPSFEKLAKSHLYKVAFLMPKYELQIPVWQQVKTS